MDAIQTSQTSGRNRLWLTRYAKVISVLGAIGLIGGIVYGAIGASELPGRGAFVLPGKTEPDGVLHGLHLASVLLVAAAFSFKAFLALALANLLTYIIGARQHPSWILRHADKALYLLAACRVSGHVVSTYFWAIMILPQAHAHWSTFPLASMGAISTVTDAIILVALGLVLRRSLPIIEESRTLV